MNENSIPKFKKSLFVFRRDFRINDNTALIHALKESEIVIPIFIVDENLIESTKGERKFLKQFMSESLKDLNNQLNEKNSHLYILKGRPSKIIEDLIQTEKIEAIFVNEDYTPYSKARDLKIKQICTKNKIKFNSYPDLLINEPNKILTQENKPFKVFSRFFKASLKFLVSFPQENLFTNYLQDNIANELNIEVLDDIFAPYINNTHQQGGRNNCLKILKSIRRLKDYKITHDIPANDTSHLSAHIKFGNCSIREIYHSILNNLGIEHPLTRQLYWRDFFIYIAHHFPYVFKHAFQKKYDKLKWENNFYKFQDWCNGNTGFPIIDAGMRQLNETGFMHNRIRMIVASFLIKDLHIDWRWGEKYFAEKLIDFDPCVNNGNWQWCASTGCDAQPYFRIFNPWLQQKKFDPECTYIKKWIRELKDVSRDVIHQWYKNEINLHVNYPKPIIDHSIESKMALIGYKSIKI